MSYVIAQDLSVAVDAAIQTSLRNLPDFDKVDVTVTWNGGLTAGTRWSDHEIGGKRHLKSHINMPTLPATATVSRHEADVMTGFAIHEMGHNICTDRAVWREACAKGGQYAQILNTFEDPRMEMDLVSRGRFAGAKRCLELLTEYCVRKSNGWNPADPKSLAFSINTLAYVEWCGYDVPSAEGLLDRAGPLAPHIRMWTDKLKTCKTTADAWALTQEFFDYYQQQQDLPDEGLSGDDFEVDDIGSDDYQFEHADPDADTSEAEERNKQIYGETDAGPGQPEDTDEDADEQGPVGPAEDKPSDAELGENGGDGQAVNIDPSEQMDSERDVSNMAQDIRSRQPETRGLSVSTDVSTQSLTLTGDTAKRAKAQAKRIRQKLPRNVAAARQRITRLLRNPDRRGELRGRDRGRLDMGRLHLLSTDNNNVFNQTWKRTGERTAVGLLIDNSSSMKGSNNKNAVGLGYVFGDAMDAANIRFSVASFPNVRMRDGREYERTEESLLSEERAMPERFGTSAEMGLDSVPAYTVLQDRNLDGGTSAMCTLKPFDKPWSKHDVNLTALYGHTRGGTPMTEALMRMAVQMRHLDEDKKVIFILTDGAYSDPALTQMVKMANIWGIKVVGLEISWRSEPEFAETMNAHIHDYSVQGILQRLDELANELA